MDFFNNEDFELLAKWAGKKVVADNPEHQKVKNRLKLTYEKVEHWMRLIVNDLGQGYESKIRKDPKNMGHNFESYLWGQIYLDGTKKTSKIALTPVVTKDRKIILKIDVMERRLEGDRDEVDDLINSSGMESYKEWAYDDVANLNWVDFLAESMPYARTFSKNLTTLNALINRVGIVASMAWNSNKWAGDPSQEDLIHSSGFAHVNTFGTTHEAINFGHKTLPAEAEGYFIGYTPKFNAPKTPKREDVEVIFLTSQHIDTKKYVIVGYYKNPVIKERFARTKSLHPIYDKYDYGNFKSKVDDIFLLEKPVLFDEDKFLPKGKERALQGFNYIDGRCIDAIFKEIEKENNMSTSATAPTDYLDLDSKNVIFYGPPGTGKTRMIQNLTELFTTIPNNTNHNIPFDKLKNLTWWECLAYALADRGEWTSVPALKKHPIIVQKLRMQANNSISNTIWLQLMSHTIHQNEFVKTPLEKRYEPLIFEKDDKSQWRLVAGWESLVPEIDELVKKYKNSSNATGEQQKNYKFITFHPNYSYEDFILGIKPDTDEQEGVRYVKTSGKFKEICDEAKLEENKNKNYAVFIDEINRGNIPAIFGELITLIEDDKRGMEIDIPGTSEKFCVPDNVWIFATMNTADRSVESLDLALRRRFIFKGIYPDPKVLNGKVIDGVNLEELLRAVNERIEILKDQDHMIGHSYFLRVNDLEDLKSCFQNRILPLLKEYFHNDFSKIGLILGRKFVEILRDNKDSIFADFDPDLVEEFEDHISYRFTSSEKWTADFFKSIYA